MKSFFVYTCALSLFLCCQYRADGQLLKKLKDKVNSVVNPNSTTNSQANSANGNGPANKTGAGLKNTPPPDIPTNMDNAVKSMRDSNFSQTRYALQQAIMGVEIKLGKQILESLPKTVDGLPKKDSQDIVASTQFGWSNMQMQTVYSNGKEKQMKVTIGNMPMYAGLVSLYFGNNVYVSNQQKNPNIKQTQVKGEKAIIQFDQNKGYTLIVQLGQATIVVWECVNFATEDEVMGAATSFDLAGIKKQMGEQ
ncbi:MAG TPA: hypothetical protein VKR32_14630 [Puia sp.]|nr:hypothetical protein [Puia sp.]